MRSRTIIVAAALAAAVGVTGASAFTTATVERDAQIDVRNDATGVIKLAEGNASAASVSSGKLVLGFDDEGLNRDATFVYGDTADPGATGGDAFYVQNNDDQTHSFEINYTGSGSASVTLYAVDSSGDVTTPKTGSSVTVSSVGQNEKVYVAAEVLTPDSAPQTINGTLAVSAS